MKSALIIWGGWPGHEPEQCATIVAAMLRADGFNVRLETDPEQFGTLDLTAFDLIVPIITQATISRPAVNALAAAVQGGVGLAGFHGGMGDSFRNEVAYQFMVGGQWVAHPGNDGRHYWVNISEQNPITAGLQDFEVRTEKYYMHVDPAIRVMATTTFEDYGNALMPVTWTKTYGKGRVFYCSLGHQANIVEMPQTLTMMRRGIRWAAGEWQTEMGLPFAKAYAASL